MGVELSADVNGVALEVLPPVDFSAWFGTAAAPLQPVGPPAGNAVQLTIWRAADAAIKDQKEDLHFLILVKQLKEPYRVGACVPSFLADWQAVLLDLERAQQPLPQIMATDLLMECFGSEFADKMLM